MTTQEKFIAAMEKLAKDRGVDLVVDTSAANVGRLSFQSRGSFTPWLTFSFNFQVGYAGFNGEDLGDTPRDRRWSYVTAEPGQYRTLNEFVDHVRHRLDVVCEGVATDDRL